MTPLHAALPGFTAFLSGDGMDYASSVTSDAVGNTYVAGLTYSPHFPTTPGVVQTTMAGTCDAFVAKFGPDGKVIWSTLLGGLLDDWATGVKVDSGGNVIVAGWTRSVGFPVANAIQPVLNSGVSPGRFDAFVTKLDPTGTKLIFSTFLGGPDDDGAYAMTLDSGGNVYLTGAVQTAAGFTGFPSSATGFGVFVSKLTSTGTLAYSLFHAGGSFAGIAAGSGIAVDSAGAAYVASTIASAYPVATTHSFGPMTGSSQAAVFKVAPDGSKIEYETAVGGGGSDTAMAVAVDATGAPYLAGITTSADFPLVKPLQRNFGGRPLWKSSDGGATWKPLENPPFTFLKAVVADPASPSTLYAATSDSGIFKSIDTGLTWTAVNRGLSTTRMHALAIDPLHPLTLYAGTDNSAPSAQIYKTTDGGNNWVLVDSDPGSADVQLAVDAQNPGNVYWNAGANFRKSTNAGGSWTKIPFPASYVATFSLDPRVSGNIYAASYPIYLKPPAPSEFPFIYHSTDGGVTWTRATADLPVVPPGLIIDASTTPSTVYNGLSSLSTDNGVTWTKLPTSPVSGNNTNVAAVDPAGTVYAATNNQGFFVSRDRGQTFTAIGSPDNYNSPYVLSLIPVGSTGTIFAVLQNIQTSGFLTKLSADGASIAFSTYLNGHPSLSSYSIFAAEPGLLGTQNWISAVTLDLSGNVVVAGGARSKDIRLANPLQPANAGGADAYVATLTPDGGRLLYSTYLGGSQDDGALGVAVDSQGNLLVAGQTFSRDFPLSPGVSAPSADYGDAFVVRLAPPAVPAITSVSNAASYLPGIEAGSWAMIKGSGLANTTRTWRSDDFVGGQVPTSLDGVSVTINGKPAFVYYISPSQINVQAPSDSATGAVDVVVTNNGAVSLPGSAQLQALSPAFFTFLGTSYAVGSRLPGYVVVGDPSTPVKPGDTVVLWGTGFGPTTPSVPAGIAVAGAPTTATLPVVTVGGQPAQLISAVLTTGTVGLYQITIQIPANLSSGPAALEASIGGAKTQPGLTLYVGN